MIKNHLSIGILNVDRLLTCGLSESFDFGVRLNYV